LNRRYRRSGHQTTTDEYSRSPRLKILLSYLTLFVAFYKRNVKEKWKKIMKYERINKGRQEEYKSMRRKSYSSETKPCLQGHIHLSSRDHAK
jgi:hypothetical protein